MYTVFTMTPLLHVYCVQGSCWICCPSIYTVFSVHHDLSLCRCTNEGVWGCCWRLERLSLRSLYTIFTMTSLSLCRCPQGGDEGAAGDAVPPPPDPGGAPGGPLLRQWDQLQVGEVVVTHVYFLLKASPEISACFKVYLWILITYTMFFKRNS